MPLLTEVNSIDHLLDWNSSSRRVSGEKQTIAFQAQRWGTMGLKSLNKNAQNIIEYAIVVSIISIGIFAMSTYVFRSVQATQKVITEEFTAE